MECPCKNCKEREVGCHGYCELYKNWSDENHRIRTKVQKQQTFDRMIEDDLVRKRMRRKRK